MPDNKGEQTVEAPTESAPPDESQEQEVQVDQPEQEAQPQSTESETVKNEEGEVPKDNAAWAAQRVKNKELERENQRLKEVVGSVDPAYLESLRGATSPQEYPNQRPPSVTGDADYSEVTNSVNFANQEAARANQRVAALSNQLELSQDREAERAYPELKTDKVFQQIVAEKKLAARVLGAQRTTLEIADEVSRLLGRRDEQVTAQTEEATKQRMVERQAISSEPRGKTSGGRSSQTNEDLRQRVRKGDTQAETELAKDIIADLEIV